jgi:hypothetical protein
MHAPDDGLALLKEIIHAAGEKLTLDLDVLEQLAASDFDENQVAADWVKRAFHD